MQAIHLAFFFSSIFTKSTKISLRNCNFTNFRWSLNFSNFGGQQGLKNRPPSGHLRLKYPVWRVKKSFFVDSLVTSGQIGDKKFFKADNADVDRTRSRKVRGSFCRSKMQGSWPFGPRRPCLRVNPPPVQGALPEILLSRPSELSGAEETSYTFWLSVCPARRSSTRVLFSLGLSGESAPVHRQRLVFAASVWSKKKERRRIQRRRFEGGRREGASSKEGWKFQRASIIFYTYTHTNLPLRLR